MMVVNGLIQICQHKLLLESSPKAVAEVVERACSNGDGQGGGVWQKNYGARWPRLDLLIHPAVAKGEQYEGRASVLNGWI